jgi:hypothetical protein
MELGSQATLRFQKEMNMRTSVPGLLAGVAVFAIVFATGIGGQARTPRSGQGQAESRGTALQTRLADTFFPTPLSAVDQAYGAIDGRHLHESVVEQAAISRRYRDAGHPQFWGRVIGTSSDAESAHWLLEKFKRIGLTDTHIQPIDLVPQWMPQSWEVTATSGDKTLHLDGSAQPAYGTPGTTPDGLEVEAAYVGLGTEADFAGRDVRGKAAIVVSMPKPGPGAATTGALQRAQQQGAVAIFDVLSLPGNLRYQTYPVNTSVPTFALGMEDGQAVRSLIAQAPVERPAHLKIRLDVRRVPNLKTGLVWGTLPGATDETIYVIAHRDGWFDASSDNASGVSAMLGLAEYFAKIPLDKRRRTMVFLGMDGHHNSGQGAGAGREWLVAHRDEFFTKTALMINCEHPSNLQSYLIGSVIEHGNTSTAQQWYAGGPSRPQLREIAAAAFREFGLSTWVQPSPQPPGGDLGRFYWFVPGVASSDNSFLHFHTNADSPETVPWSGLQAATRSYAKIIDEVNKLDLKDLQRPAIADPRPPTASMDR